MTQSFPRWGMEVVFDIRYNRLPNGSNCGLCGRKLGVFFHGPTLQGLMEDDQWNPVCHYCGVERVPEMARELMNHYHGNTWDGLGRYECKEETLATTREGET
jgi:hypothetical protein